MNHLETALALKQHAEDPHLGITYAFVLKWAARILRRFAS